VLRLTGSDDAIFLDDRLNGESGADILMGGLGSDHLDGGKGANFKSRNI
jgi:Ca2+-binding RTX toxin-like protein